MSEAPVDRFSAWWNENLTPDSPEGGVWTRSDAFGWLSLYAVFTFFVGFAVFGTANHLERGDAFNRDVVGPARQKWMQDCKPAKPDAECIVLWAESKRLRAIYVGRERAAGRGHRP